MMPVPNSEMKGFRSCNCPLPQKAKKLCPCCVECPRPRKSKSKPSSQKVGPLNMIESEYIKNLQLQIYYLEMESKYLWKRSQEQKKKTEGSNYKTVDSSWEKPVNKDTTRDSSGVYTRYRNEDSGKYDKYNTYDNRRSYDKPNGYSAYKPDAYSSYNRTPSTCRPNITDMHRSSSYKSTAYESPGKYDPSKYTTDHKDSDINDNLDRLIKNVKSQDETLKKLSSDKARVDELLNREKRIHSKDMNNAREELDNLRKDLESERQQKSQCEMELNRLTQNLKENEENLRQLHLDKSLLQDQMSQRDTHLQSVKSVLEDTRSGLMNREDEINELKDKYDKSHELFNRVAGEMKEEHKILREHLSEADMKIQELESNRDALVDTNRRLLKENVTLEEVVTELQGQLQIDEGVLDEKEKQREMAANKISSMANDIRIIRAELQESKQKVSDLDHKLQETMENLYAQESQNERLEKRLSSATNRATELESIRERLATDIRELQDERSSLLDRTSLLESELCYQRGEVEQLQDKSQKLNTQLKDVEELKNVQNSLQTQKWEEFGQLANSMRHLSRCMSSQGTTVYIETE